MGTITEIVLGKPRQIDKPWEIKTGKTLVEIERVIDGEVLTFSSPHAWSISQIIHQFELARHFHGTNGNGNVDAHIAASFGTINPTQTTGLSDGDIIQLRIGYTGGNSGPATIPYTIPAGTFRTVGSTGPSFTGSFVDSPVYEEPQGTAAEKQAEFMRITTIV